MQRDAQLRGRISGFLQGFERLAGQTQGRRSAAVAVAVIDEGHGADVPGLPPTPGWSTRAALLLTRRSQRLRNHAGQWALPGGRIDPGETPETAALRELAEETGLELAPEAILGRLDDFPTRSGYLITPVVMWAGPARELAPNPDEVHSVHRIPVAELMREDAPLLEQLAEHEHPVLRMPVGEHWIAAPTAALLYQFREVCIAGRPTRVSHFEQPAFAWR
jgi:8-oxo-dGTP pyrophosphatase MutT (NUDIX family)